MITPGTSAVTMIYFTGRSSDSTQVIQRLRRFAVIAPAAFLIILLAINFWVLPEVLPSWAAFAIGATAGATGIYAFARIVFGVIETLQSRLAQESEDAAVLRERERIAFELHDGAIQALYGVGLNLEDCIERLGDTSDEVRDDLDRSIDNLNAIIRNIRGFIFSLDPSQREGAAFSRTLTDLLRHHAVNTLMTAELGNMGDTDPSLILSEQQAAKLTEIAAEIIANIRQHSRASHVSAEIFIQGDKFYLRIVDDGVGIGDPFEPPAGGGIVRMRSEVADLDGEFLLEALETGGTSVSVSIPVATERN